ncbi:hypothetical protein HJFPF1_07497 [Paramyrothecium foliicola]|nr:hypothetical protein HJFPF1_07497 [Paramyrothecium foliicola]
MSKQPIEPSFPPADDLPPPYTSSPNDIFNPSTVSAPAPSLFTSQLSNLRHQIHSQQAARVSAREEKDSQLLALLAPHVEDFLSSIATFNPTPSRAEAILLPSEAVSEEWQLSDEQETRPGEIREVFLVQRHDKFINDGKGASQSSYGGSSSADDANLWWADEKMARRLARHLQPERGNQQIASPVPQPASIPRQEKKPSKWKFFSRESAAESTASSSRAPVLSNQAALNEVTMSTRAEEVTFRKENDFGIWESKTGWGIVVQVRLPRQ